MILFDGDMCEKMRMGEYKYYHKNNLIYYTNYLQSSHEDDFLTKYRKKYMEKSNSMAMYYVNNLIKENADRFPAEVIITTL